MLGPDPIGAKLTSEVPWHLRFPVMAGLDPAIRINTMLDQMEHDVAPDGRVNPPVKPGDGHDEETWVSTATLAPMGPDPSISRRGMSGRKAHVGRSGGPREQ